MRKFKSVPVERTNLLHYRKRAEECFRLARYALENGLWLGTCINAVHAGIALADCLSIFLRGTRYSGMDHDEAIRFYSTLQTTDPAFRQSIQNLGKLISVKNASEYADKPISEKDAQAAWKALLRFRDFILQSLPS